MKSIITTLLSGAVLFSLTGCASMFGDNNRIVHINSVPANATVIVDNATIASKTPTQTVIAKMFSPTIITIQKPGCSPTTVIVDPTFQKVGLWNILVPPGFIVDAITGDMMKVPENQRNIDAKLCQK